MIRRVPVIRRVLFVLVAAGAAFPGVASAEQASAPTSTAAAALDSGDSHTCAVGTGGRVRCWGFNGNGQLGYGNERTIGDDESPGSVAPVDVGAGRTGTGVGLGNFHSCAVLDDGRVRCWGSGLQGQLGRLQNLSDLGDDETPGSAATVDLGPGRTARAVSGGGGHTCAVLDDANVRCWGFGFRGRLGYGNENPVGITETPGSVGPVDLGAGRTAIAVTAGNDHTCALLDDATVRCWGEGSLGRLGYGNTQSIGDNETPGSVPPLDLGPGRTATAISAGGDHTCAVLDNGSVRCWGQGANGQLGYGNTTDVGDDESPASVPAVDLGPGRTATAISAGPNHTCAVLDGGDIRCWGDDDSGSLGLGSLDAVGDNETPGSLPPVALGTGRHALAVSLGTRHTCARLDDASVRCWGFAGNGRLGYCSVENIGDDETPGSAGPVALLAAAGGGCEVAPPATPRKPPAHVSPSPPGADPDVAALTVQAARLRGLRGCLARASRHTRREVRRVRRLSGARRVRARRHARSHKRRSRARCFRRYARRPGRVIRISSASAGPTSIVLTFSATGTHGTQPPAALRYLVKQSRRPIRTARAFRRAQTVCDGSCNFPKVRVGATLSVLIGDLHPRTTYYYAVAARDNVSCRLGPRSRTVSARTGPVPPHMHSTPLLAQGKRCKA